MPVKFKAPPKVTPAVLLMIRLLIVLLENVAAGIVCAEDPFIAIVPLLTLKVPLLLVVPPICNVAVLTVNEAPLAIVILLMELVPELITG